MRFYSGETNAADAAKDMASEFRCVRRDAKVALLDRDAKNFRMYFLQMKCMLDIEFVDMWENESRIISYLTQEEQRNPYQLSYGENIAVSQWISRQLREQGNFNEKSDKETQDSDSWLQSIFSGERFR